MATVTGYVERIKYRNEDNGYSVLSVADGGEEYILVGTFPYISEGERIEATGRMVEHSIYGEQLAVESYEIKAPEDTLAIERYLGSGAIKGIGAALAKRIVKKFKADTFRIMEEEPERLAEVKGVSERMAMEISSQVEEKRDMRQAMVFLQQYGISMNLAVKIYQHYGPKMYSVIQENPYQLADDIQGVGFKIADEIAAKVGIFTDSDYRIRSGLFYALLQATGNGHTYLPEEELFANASALLNVEPEHMEKHLVDLQMEKKLVVKEKDGKRIVYPAQFYYMELNTARMLHDLNIHSKINEEDVKKRLKKITEAEKIELDDIRPSSRKYPYIDFRPSREIGNEVLSVEGITKTIDGVKVLDNVSFIVGHDDKIAFVGGNELAKTTLFKILTGEMEPDSGSYKWGVTTSQSYFPKDNTEIFDTDLLIVDWLTQYSEIKDATYVRGFLGRMLFAGEDGTKKMRVLSGGEKVRVLLSRMMIMATNVLILDEPTDHLDMESITALNNGLIKFPGVVLFASRDHQVVQTTANRIIEFLPDGTFIDKVSTYDEYLENDEMARKRQVYNMSSDDENDN